MRKKIFKALNNIYGVLMFTSFFAGFLPIVPFIIAIIVGGDFAANVCNFLYNQYYPWVIILGCVAIVIGLVAMYIGKLEGLSVKKVSTDDKSLKDDKNSN